MLDLVSNSIQIGLTITFVWLCIALLRTWWSSVHDALKAIEYWRVSKAWEVWTPEDWLGVGIAIGFFGNIIDNVYWGVTWLAVYSESVYEPVLFEYGPVSNIFFRQTIGIIAVYCHLHAAKIMHGDAHSVDRSVKRSFATGIIMSGLLFFGGLRAVIAT